MKPFWKEELETIYEEHHTNPDLKVTLNDKFDLNPHSTKYIKKIRSILRIHML